MSGNSVTKISSATARRLVMASQGLGRQWRLPRGREGVAQTIERLGYVQIDTLAVVRRAHHHTLWSRRSDYTPQMLHRLHVEDRRIFEYWTHAASYVPMADYRYYVPRMRRWGASSKTKKFMKNNAKLARNVLGRIRKEGALSSADFKETDGRKRGSWWDWKPAKMALETLFSMGELMVSERRNFRRLYDLAERVLPGHVDTSPPSRDELARFTVRRELASQGLSKLKGWWVHDREAAWEALDELVDSGEVTTVLVEGAADGRYYALTESLDAALRSHRMPRQLHILSPFDNMVIRRNRVKDLFGFECKLECYFPAAKRRYGYFCLPILWKDRFIGRLDPKADRKSRTLIVRKLLFEPGFGDYDEVLPHLADRIGRFAAFNGCDRTVIKQTQPGHVRASFDAFESLSCQCR